MKPKKSTMDKLNKLNLDSLGLDQLKSTKDLLDFDLEELSNEVDGLETLAQQMESLTFTDMIDDGLFLGSKKDPDQKGVNGKRSKDPNSPRCCSPQVLLLLSAPALSPCAN